MPATGKPEHPALPRLTANQTRRRLAKFDAFDPWRTSGPDFAHFVRSIRSMKTCQIILAFMLLIAVPESALASDMIALDCTNQGVEAGVLIFDTKNNVAQKLRNESKPIFFPDYGRIFPGKVTDATFAMQELTYEHKPGGTLSISRETTLEAASGPKTPLNHFKCGQRSENVVSFAPPLLSADIDGNIGIICREFYREPRVGELYPVNDQIRVFGLNTVSKEVVGIDPTSGTKQFGTIGHAGPDSIQICESGDCRRTWVLNLITGGLFPMIEFAGDFRLDSKTQFVCTPKP